MQFFTGDNKKRVCLLLVLWLIAAPIAVYGAVAPVLTPSDFTYVLENRADPFLPFISEKSTSVDLNEIVESEEPLTGMQLFEPGQLRLVALLRVGSRSAAMVEDFTGKGYVLREGMPIGRRGVVKQIAADVVIIEEKARTRAGKEIVSTIEMALKKEEKKE